MHRTNTTNTTARRCGTPLALTSASCSSYTCSRAVIRGAARTLAFVVVCGIFSTPAFAQQLRRSLIEQALTEPTRITLEQVTLRDAIASITEQTGVDIFMAPEVMALVPGGPDTIIQRVEIANVPLRKGLDQLFAPLGMTYRVSDDGLHILPKEAIRCLGRAPTWEELDVLTELTKLEPGREAPALEAVHKRIQFRVPVRRPWSLLEKAIRDTGAGQGDAVLDAACDKLGWTWCLSGRYIVITPREQDIVRRLQRPISLRVRHEPLFKAISAVGDAAGVSIRVEPGALASLNRSLRRNFTLELRGQSAERALEMIAAYTGLGYLVEPSGVLVFNPGASSSKTPAGAARLATDGDPYAAKIVVPLGDGTSVEWLVRFSELPPDMRARRADDLKKAFSALKR